MIAHLVIGTAFLVLTFVVPISAAAIVMGDGALSRWATRARRAVARFAQAGQRGPSPAHPAWDAHVDEALGLTRPYPPGGDWDRWESELAGTRQQGRPR